MVKFLSTPSARRATKITTPNTTVWTISIHALREEGDPDIPTPVCACCDFYPRPPRGGRPHRGRSVRPGIRISIHALREEGDASSRPAPRAAPIFLSTPSARRATGGLPHRLPPVGISIHALREEGDRLRPRSCVVFSHISIHALREEGDQHHIGVTVPRMDFYPRPPRGGRLPEPRSDPR